MKPAAWFDLPMRHRAWRPRPMRWVMQDLAGVARQPEQAHRTHLRATLEWLCRAQDASRAMPGSVAGGWTFEAGWLPGSTEASGWLIETFVPAAEYLAWPELTDRAHRMLDSLLAQPDTAAVGRIQGLIAGHVQLGRADSLARALESGHLLGTESLAAPAHSAEAAHALARLGQLVQDARWLEAARRHLEAALAQQTPCGWFADPGAAASTAGLARTVRGVAEAAAQLEDAHALRAARRAAEAMGAHLREDGWLPGAFDDGWMPAAAHACVRGTAGMAACWLRLAQSGQGAHLRDAAWRALAWIKRNQRTTGDDLALRDALPSAVPIWGGPSAFSFDTLGAKYFADALMMDMVGIAIPPLAQKAEPA